MASSYAATTTRKIRMFRNGDENFFGKTLVLNPRQVRSYDRFLETVTSQVGFGQAVRSIRTPRYGSMVQSLDDLEDQQDYVAVGIGRFKNIGYIRQSFTVSMTTVICICTLKIGDFHHRRRYHRSWGHIPQRGWVKIYRRHITRM